MEELTIFNSLWLGFSMGVLHAFCCHLNIILITGVCFEIPCPIVFCFAETGYLNFIAIELTDCHMMQDLGVGNLGTD